MEITPVLTRRDVANLTAKAFGIAPRELFSCCRTYNVVWPRQAAYLLIREFMPDSSLSQIGKTLNKDHTTVIHGLRQAKWREGNNPVFAAKLNEARNLIREWPSSRQIELETAKQEPAAATIAEIQETPPRAKPEPITSNPRSLEMRSAGFEYDNWFRLSCKNSEDQFLAIARRVHPERVREFPKEAAE